MVQIASSEISNDLKAHDTSNVLPPLPSLQFSPLQAGEWLLFFLTRQLQSPLYWSADSSRPAGQDRYQLLWGCRVNAALVLFKDAFHMVDALCW